jgi:hypothetical protein
MKINIPKLFGGNKVHVCEDRLSNIITSIDLGR